MSRICVTGIGVVTAIGQNLVTNRDALVKGRTGIGTARHFKSKYIAERPFAEVDTTTDELLSRIEGRFNSGLTRTCAFSILAAQEAIDGAKLTEADLKSFDTGLISSSTVGGMCLTDQLYLDANLASNTRNFLGSYGFWSHTLRLIEKFGFRGLTDTLNTACSSSANAIMLGSRLIKARRLKRAIVGGADALAKFTVNGFNALRILSEEPCKPFDRDRDGLNLGEGAAYLVLEDESVVQDKEVLAYVSGYGNANDAYHASRISEEANGVVEAIAAAVRSSGLEPKDIDYINAHGTGTENNDLSEIHALRKIFGELPPFSSTKSFTGHTLAAAGSIEAVFSILALRNQEIYPSLNFTTTFDPHHEEPLTEYKKARVENVLSNSIGFAGSCTSLIFSRA